MSMEEITMSKKHHNYTNYSKPQQPAPVVEAPVETKEEEVVNTVIEETPVVAPVVEPETKVEDDELIGVVIDCVKLNVRAEASVNADVVTEISVGTEVMVDIFESTAEFYKVVTEAGVEGFCMKKFINID
jgi:uncharacterized protein YgiM (DUF1202 family)